MKDKVQETIRKFELLNAGDRVIVGLSGGADSISLINVLLELQKDISTTIFAAHVNHLLRDEESFRDEQFVRDWCLGRGITLAVRHIDVGKEARIRGLGTEECGRQVRYEFFEELGVQWDAKIATAHTLSDSMETSLFNLARGTGITGFCGIPAKRGKIIRPLIGVTRSEVEKYCWTHDLEYMNDSTNESGIYARNRIRHDVIPALYSVNNGFDRAFLRFTESLKGDNKFLFELAKKELENVRTEYGYNTEELSKLHDSILARCLRLLIAGKDSTALHIRILIDCIRSRSGSVTLPDGRVFVIRNGYLIEQTYKNPKLEWSRRMEVPLTECPNGKIYEFRIITLKSFKKFKKVPKKVFINCLDYDMISIDAILRSRQAGDKITPALRNITKTIKKLLIEEKVPREQRNSLAVLESDGEVIWAEGVAVSEQVSISPNTQRILLIQIYNKE